MPRVNKKQARREALKRIEEYFRQAELAYKTNPGLAHRLVQKARRVAMRVQMPLPKKYKHRMCKYCYHLLVPGYNCRVRIQKGRIITYCRDCKHFTRRPL